MLSSRWHIQAENREVRSNNMTALARSVKVDEEKLHRGNPSSSEEDMLLTPVSYGRRVLDNTNVKMMMYTIGISTIGTGHMVSI